ncbi:MAG: gfo/Idh/MocA family oxidoreductase, partial [Isosphaeraceae bacterium]
EAGEITTLLANDYRSGRWAKPKQSSGTEMYYQMRNWYNFTWLSGDFNLEQHVHFLDVCAYMARSTLLAIVGRMAAYTRRSPGKWP